MATSGCHRTTFWACILLIFSLYPANCWDTDDLELFDLVEEVNANFYEVLGVSQTATSSEVKKAYRKKTLILHPDKSEAPDADEQFRKLVAVYEVLKDEEKREKYNAVLENGLPDWRQPVYYYRKARKLGLAELFAVLCFFITVGQYFVLWAIYLERRLAMEDFFQSKKKREKKGKRKAAAINDQIEEDLQETIDSIPKPRLRNLWPITFSVWLVQTTINMPSYVREWKQRKKVMEEMKRLEELEKEENKKQEELMRQEQELRKQKRKTKPERKRAPVDMAGGAPVMYGQGNQSSSEEEEDEALKQTTKGGSWTDEDYVMLSKAYIKFPGGITNRWEKIAALVGRPVSEVTAKCKLMKGNFTMNLSASVQAGTKHSKNTMDISDKIISTQDPEESSKPLNNSDDTETTLRKRNKTQPLKDSQQTISISKQNQKRTTDLKSRSDIETGSKVSSQNSNNAKVVITNMNQSKAANGTAGGKITVKKVAAQSEDKNPVAKIVPKKQDNMSLDANVDVDVDNWSQKQQMILEKALRQFPKGTDQRWEKIAEHIPSKTKDDCILRVKRLAELVKQKKQQQS